MVKFTDRLKMAQDTGLSVFLLRLALFLIIFAFAKGTCQAEGTRTDFCENDTVNMVPECWDTLNITEDLLPS